MGFSFFSINDPKGLKLVDCFKVENTTYCDSPKNGKGLDVLKIENSSADPNTRITTYYTRDYRVERELTGVITPRINRLYTSQPREAYFFETKRDPKKVESSEPFFVEMMQRSQFFTQVLSGLIGSEQIEWEITKDQRGNLVYQGDFKMVISDKSTRKMIDLSLKIRIPKEGNIGKEGYPLYFKAQGTEYRYQFQTLPQNLQQALYGLRSKKAEEKEKTSEGSI